MFVLIENGDVFLDGKFQPASVLLAGDRIVHCGEIDRTKVKGIGAPVEVVDADYCYVTPGYIDPHQHLLGGSGESGFSSQSPNLNLCEIVKGGVTTVVGCLGVDTTMKTMAGLLARAKALEEERLTAYVWSGGYNVPPSTITGSIRNDIMFIDEVIGAGEIAISDERSTDPKPHELARLVSDAYVGGMLAEKAGATHFHVGDRDTRLKILNQLLDDYHCQAASIYPTHIGRNDELFKEAIDLAKRGCYVDLDTADENLAERLTFYIENGGDLGKLTLSSDAGSNSPWTLFDQIRECVTSGKFRFEQLLPLVTSNTAAALKLRKKGAIAPGNDADIAVIESSTFEIRELMGGGRRFIRGGSVAVKEKFLKESNRWIDLVGDKPVPEATADSRSAARA